MPKSTLKKPLSTHLATLEKHGLIVEGVRVGRTYGMEEAARAECKAALNAIRYDCGLDIDDILAGVVPDAWRA